MQDVWTAPGPDGPVYGTNVRIYDPAAGGRTILRVRHSGFGDGDAWDEVRSFFQWSWFEILRRFQREMGG